jgi:hypothetical protein
MVTCSSYMPPLAPDRAAAVGLASAAAREHLLYILLAIHLLLLLLLGLLQSTCLLQRMFCRQWPQLWHRQTMFDTHAGQQLLLALTAAACWAGMCFCDKRCPLLLQLQRPGLGCCFRCCMCCWRWCGCGRCCCRSTPIRRSFVCFTLTFNSIAVRASVDALLQFICIRLCHQLLF